LVSKSLMINLVNIS